MKLTAADYAIKKLTDKIVILQLAIEEIQAAQATAPVDNVEPKVRKPRRKRGMPAVEGL